MHMAGCVHAERGKELLSVVYELHKENLEKIRNSLNFVALI